MTDEDRTVGQFEAACWKYAGRRYLFSDYDQGDVMQEARLAALKAVRSFDATKGNRSLLTWVLYSIRGRMANLKTIEKHPTREMMSTALPIDGGADNDGSDTIADTLPSADRADTSLLRIACESLCNGGIEVDILDAIQSCSSLADVGRKNGLSRERVRQIKEQLLARLRAELA